MRRTLNQYTWFLCAIAITAMVCGAIVISILASLPSTSQLSTAMTIVYASIPIAVGTIALGALAITHAIDVATHRHIEVFLNEARHAAHHMEARRPSSSPPAHPPRSLGG